jgi:hypothetical protein
MDEQGKRSEMAKSPGPISQEASVPVLRNSHPDELLWTVLESTHAIVHLVDLEGHLLYRKKLS